MFFSLVAEKKKLLLADKYQELKKSGKLDNFLSKKRKRNAGKDRRKLPQGHKDSWQNLTEFNWNRKENAENQWEFCNDWCPPAGGTLSQMVALCLSHSMSFCIIIALDETEILHHSATRRSKEKNTDTEAAAPCLKVCHRKARKLNKHNRCNKHKTMKLVLKT